MSQILIVEDEQHIAEGLRFNLEAEGHHATIAADGERALALLLGEQRPFDAVILDIMLPGKDGFAVAAELRAAGQYVPILMLTARGSAADVLRGFEAGTDDYLPKPFELSILMARVKGLLRRRQWNEQETPAAGVTHAAVPDVYTFAGRTLDFSAMEVRVRDRTQRLTVLTGGRVDVRRIVDPDLLGGLQVRLGDRLIDGSVRGRLERLRSKLSTTTI